MSPGDATLPNLPNTPYEVLQVSNPASRVIIAIVVRVAEWFGFWRRPMKGAASDIAEMGLIDNLNWIYKSKNFVTAPELALDARTFMAEGSVSLAATPSDAETVRLNFVGDILRCAGIDHARDRIYAQVADLIFDADLSIANFESPVTTDDLVDEIIGDAGPPMENCSEPLFDVLTSHDGHRLDVLNLANNHIFDKGAEGLATTMATLAARGIAQIGLVDDPAGTATATVFERSGLKIGFATATFGINSMSTPEGWAVKHSPLTPKRGAPDLGLIKAQIDDARAQGADLVVAVLHWGHEFEMFPRVAQQKAARDLAEYGADLIVCHHSHVSQPIELYECQTSGRTVPIAYSLGSLVWGFMHDAIATSLVLGVDVVRSGDGAAIAALTATKVRRATDVVDGHLVQVVRPVR